MARPAHGVMRHIAETLYDEARCGVSHDGMIRNRMLLRASSKPPVFVSMHKTSGKIAAIILNVPKVLEVVSDHLDSYVATLRDPRNVKPRQNFEKVWAIRHPTDAIIRLPPEAFSGRQFSATVCMVRPAFPSQPRRLPRA